MVAGGTGITPMYQLLPFLAKLASAGTQPRVRMVFANHSVEDILLRDELDEFAAVLLSRCPLSSCFMLRLLMCWVSFAEALVVVLASVRNHRGACALACAVHCAVFSSRAASRQSPGPAKAAAPKHKTPADAIRGHISAAVLRTAFKDTLVSQGLCSGLCQRCCVFIPCAWFVCVCVCVLSGCLWQAPSAGVRHRVVQHGLRGHAARNGLRHVQRESQNLCLCVKTLGCGYG
jgi:hypothetical protein